MGYVNSILEPVIRQAVSLTTVRLLLADCSHAAQSLIDHKRSRA